MANTAGPIGFNPTQRADGAAWTGNFEFISIASGYGTAINRNDAVKTVNNQVQLAAPGDPLRGIAIGFRYTDPNTGRIVEAVTWPAGQIAADAICKVVQDPNVEIQARMTSATPVAQADFGKNYNLVVGTATFGKSGASVDYTTKTASQAQFKLIGFVIRADNDTTSANPFCRFYYDNHELRNVAGT